MTSSLPLQIRWHKDMQLYIKLVSIRCTWYVELEQRETLEGINKKQVLHRSSFSWAMYSYVSKELINAARQAQSQDAVPGPRSHPSSGLSSPPSASQGDNTTLPLTLPARVINTNQQAVCPPDEVQQQEMRLPRKFETRYATSFYQPFVLLVKPRPILQPPAVNFPQAAPPDTTG